MRQIGYFCVLLPIEKSNLFKNRDAKQGRLICSNEQKTKYKCWVITSKRPICFNNESASDLMIASAKRETNVTRQSS